MRSQNKNNYNWEIPEHLLNKLTLLQLDTLGDMDKGTNSDTTFRMVQYVKKFDVKSC
jgi:hypothetical protein